ncbi:hypothetical protein P7C70_g9081, partial [Phenoliferia sp. Uapishka_3]
MEEYGDGNQLHIKLEPEADMGNSPMEVDQAEQKWQPSLETIPRCESSKEPSPLNTSKSDSKPIKYPSPFPTAPALEPPVKLPPLHKFQSPSHSPPLSSLDSPTINPVSSLSTRPPTSPPDSPQPQRLGLLSIPPPLNPAVASKFMDRDGNQKATDSDKPSPRGRSQSREIQGTRPTPTSRSLALLSHIHPPPTTRLSDRIKPPLMQHNQPHYDFHPLMEALERRPHQRNFFSRIGLELRQKPPLFNSFKDYAIAAEQASIVKILWAADGSNQMELTAPIKAVNSRNTVPRGAGAGTNERFRTDRSREQSPPYRSALPPRTRSRSPLRLARDQIPPDSYSSFYEDSRSRPPLRPQSRSRSPPAHDRHSPLYSATTDAVHSQGPRLQNYQLWVTSIRTLNQPEALLTKSLSVVLGRERLGFQYSDVRDVQFYRSNFDGEATALVQIASEADERLRRSVEARATRAGYIYVDFNTGEIQVSLSSSYTTSSAIDNKAERQAPSAASRLQSRPLQNLRSPSLHRQWSPTSAGHSQLDSRPPTTQRHNRGRSPPSFSSRDSLPTLRMTTSVKAQVSVTKIVTLRQSTFDLIKSLRRVLSRRGILGFGEKDIRGITINHCEDPDEATAVVEIDPDFEGSLKRTLERMSEERFRHFSVAGYYVPQWKMIWSRIVLQFFLRATTMQLSQLPKYERCRAVTTLSTEKK